MGIKGFSKWLRTHYALAFDAAPKQRESYDELYVDLNSLLHTVARNRSEEGEVMEAIQYHLSSLLAQYNPRRQLFIAADGPASLSKLLEQRSRRIESRRDAKRLGTFDAQQFSPGCSFMTRMECHVEKFLKAKQSSSRLSAKLEIVFSGSASEGEGEIKIFNRLQRSSHQGSSAILAADSDTLLQAIAHGYPNTYVITPLWMAGSSERGRFRVETMLEMLAEKAIGRKALQTRLDFSLLTGFSGNDYLPRLQFGGFHPMWEQYCSDQDAHLMLAVTHHDVHPRFDINLRGLKAFMQVFSKSSIPPNLLPLQKSVLDAARSNPEATHNRIVAYLTSLRAVLFQVVGSPDQSKGIPLYHYQEAPSVAELAEMDVRKVEAALATHNSILTAPPTMLPGTAAIMMLDLCQDSLPHLPTPLRPLAELYQQQSFTTTMEGVRWLNDKICGLDRGSMSVEDALTIYPRPPTRLAGPSTARLTE